MKKLSPDFYLRDNVVEIARELLGKLLVTRFDGLTSGRIVEVEAYAGPADKASHAAGGRRTKRNEVMYGEGGFAYVYLCYGIHHLFNVVTNRKDVPHAILVRALDPVNGIERMRKRSGEKVADQFLTRGPGNLSRALGIKTIHNGLKLDGKDLFLAEDGFEYGTKEIIASPRIGVDYAGEDALLPYRFYIENSQYVSGKNNIKKAKRIK